MNMYQLSEPMQKVIEELPIPTAIYQFLNNKVKTIAVSKGFLEVFGLSSYETAVEVMDTNMYRDTYPDDIARIADISYRFAVGDGKYEAVYRSKTGNDKTRYHIIHATGQHIYTPDGTRLAVVWYIDETSALETDTSESAAQLLNSLMDNGKITASIRKNYYDDLTGLPNMEYFLTTAELTRKEILANGKIPAILFFDLNGLKYYNHQYGLAQGDELIRTLGERIRYYFDSENCGRFGSDHFAAITNRENVEEVLEKVFSDMKCACGGVTLPIRVGIYDDTFECVGISTACDRAKIACDWDKNIFKSRYVYFDETMLQKVNDKEYILQHLDEALKKGWIQDYYQPIIRAETHLVCDEEALARWIDPDRGMMRPDQFIPVLEDAGLLYKLDLYMVDRAIAFIQKKRELNIPVVPISINLSEKDFMSCNMQEEITKKLEKAGLTPDYLTIEITERAIGQNPELLSQVIDDFHEHGYKIWLDDFGSEYSSLNVLQDYRFELIKLDMKFLKKFNTSQMSRLIINEVLDLAHKANMETVTEGVETREQMAFLSSAGCVKLQGFLYSKPLPADEILSLYLQKTSLILEENAFAKEKS